MNTKASNWFDDKQKFLDVCARAQGHAANMEAQMFASQMTIRAREHGLNLYVTEKQMKWLCQIADVILPLTREQRGLE